MDIIILIILLGIVAFILIKSSYLPLSPQDSQTFSPRPIHESSTVKCPHCHTAVKRHQHGQTCSFCKKSF